LTFVLKTYSLDKLISQDLRTKKWYFFHGLDRENSRVFFKNKKTADNFLRYANKFTRIMYVQTNQLYTDVFVIWRSVYMQYSKTDKDFKFIKELIESIEFQFDRWSKNHCLSLDSATFVINAPVKILNIIKEVIIVLRRYGKKNSNTSMIYQLDSKITYLNFLLSQFVDFDKYTSKSSEITKIINLPILRMVAS